MTWERKLFGPSFCFASPPYQDEKTSNASLADFHFQAYFRGLSPLTCEKQHRPWGIGKTCSKLLRDTRKLNSVFAPQNCGKKFKKYWYVQNHTWRGQKWEKVFSRGLHKAVPVWCVDHSEKGRGKKTSMGFLRCGEMPQIFWDIRI